MIFHAINKYLERIRHEYQGNWCFAIIDVILCRIFYGTTFNDYFIFRFYDFSAKKRNTFITSRRVRMLWRETSPEANRIMGDKTLFLSKFSQYTRRDFCDTTKASLENFCSFVKKYKKVFIKPLWASEGILTQKFTPSSVAEIEQKYEELKKYPDKGALVEPYLQQHPVMSSLCSTAVNTIRVTTYTHKGICHIISCTLRMGTTGCTDNFHGGGWIAMVDPDSGVVNTLCARGKARSLFHPVSHTKVLGFEIPYWKEGLAMVKEAAEAIPEAPFVGWDLAILEDGPCLIEGNTGNNGYEVVQVADLIGKWEKIKKIKES